MRSALVALVAVYLAACGSNPESLPTPRRVVLVSLATVRADMLAQPAEHRLANLERLL
jgi:hypothetical protein